MARSSLQQRVVSWLERPPQVRTVEPPSETEKWSASQMGRGGPGHWGVKYLYYLHSLYYIYTTVSILTSRPVSGCRMVTVCSQSSLHPPSATVTSPGLLTPPSSGHAPPPHCSWSVGLPQHSSQSAAVLGSRDQLPRSHWSAAGSPAVALAALPDAGPGAPPRAAAAAARARADTQYT